MLLDKIAMITYLILLIIVGFVSLFTYLIVSGAFENKSDLEQQQEDEEQMKYLKEYRNRREKKVGKKNI